MKRMMKWVGAAVALLAVPGAALAQGRTMPGAEGQEAGMWRDISVMGQAGVLTYSGEAARFTTPGATYGVLAGVDVIRWVDAELSYQGAVYETEEDLAADQYTILENGGQALAKIGPDGWNLSPYAMGGVAITRLSVVGEPGFAVPVQDATLVKVPLGLGVDWSNPRGDGEGDLTIGARASFNLAVDSDAFTTLDDAQSSNQVQATLHLGGTW